MANRPDNSNNSLEKFRFSPTHLPGDIAQDKAAFLSRLKQTIPTHEVHEFSAKPGCLATTEEGLLYLDWDGRLVTQKSFGEVATPFEEVHKHAEFLRVSEKNGVVVTATSGGHFKVWSLTERRPIADLTTNFRRVERIEVGEQDQFLLSNQGQLFVINFKDQSFAEIKSHREEVSFDLEWLPIHGTEVPEPETPRDTPRRQTPFAPRDPGLSATLEREMTEGFSKFEQQTSEVNKKMRRSTLNRQQFLASIKRGHVSFKVQLLYLENRGWLLWGHDQVVEVLDYINMRFLGTFSLSSPASALAATEDQNQFFVGMKSGAIKIFESQDLIETGELIGHADSVTTIRSTRGSHPLVFAGARDGSVRVFHLKLMEELGQLVSKGHPLLGKGAVGGLKKSKDIQKVRFKLPTQKDKVRANVSCMCVESDQKRVFCLYDGQILRWKTQFDYKEFEYRNDKGQIAKAVIDTVEGKAVFVPIQGRIAKRDLRHDTDLVKSDPIDAGINCLAVSGDGLLVCVGTDVGKIRMLHAADLTPSTEWIISPKGIRAVQFYLEEFILCQDDSGSIFFFDLKNQLKHELEQKFVTLTCFAINEEEEMLFTAAQDLLLKHWSLKPLRQRLPPIELFTFPVGMPIQAICFDTKKKVLFYSQRETVAVYDYLNREVLVEVTPSNLGEPAASVPVGSRMFSVAGIKLPGNVDDVLNEIVATSTRQEYAVAELFHLPQLNVLVILRKNGVISAWDEAAGEHILDFDTKSRIEKGFKPSLGQAFYVWTDQGTLACFNLFRLNFFDCCYLHTFSDNMPESDFIAKMACFHELAASSPFIKKVIHPIYMAFLLNKFQGVRELLRDWGYPTLEEFQHSPLILALKGRHVNFAENLCREMARFKTPVFLAYEEIKTLLWYDYKFAKVLLTHSCEKVEHFTDTGERIRKFNFLKKDHSKFHSLTGHFTRLNFQQLVTPWAEAEEDLPLEEPAPEPKEGDDEQEKDNFVEAQYKKERLRSAVSHLAGLRHAYTDVYRVKGFYNFENGTEDDLNFLFQYSESKVESFVLSDWKHIINFKWTVCRKYYIVLALAYWSFMALFALFIFNPTNFGFFLGALGLLGILLAYEMVPLVAYPQYYIHNLTSFMDLVMYLTAGFVLVWMKQEPDMDTEALQTLQVLSLGIGFYKGISFLRIFDLMRSMTYIIYSLLGNSLDVILMMLYVAVGLAIIMNLTMPTQPLYSQFIWVLYMTFCSFPMGEEWTYLHFAVVLLLILLMSLLMVNFVVAKMSSKYFELERKQKATNFKEMAKVIFEFELWYHLLKRRSEAPRTTTYFVMKSAEPTFDITETLAEEGEEEVDTREIGKSLESLRQAIQKMDGNLDLIEGLKRDLSKISSSVRTHDSSSDIREIKGKLGEILRNVRRS